MSCIVKHVDSNLPHSLYFIFHLWIRKKKVKGVNLKLQTVQLSYLSQLLAPFLLFRFLLLKWQVHERLGHGKVTNSINSHFGSRRLILELCGRCNKQTCFKMAFTGTLWQLVSKLNQSKNTYLSSIPELFIFYRSITQVQGNMFQLLIMTHRHRKPYKFYFFLTGNQRPLYLDGNLMQLMQPNTQTAVNLWRVQPNAGARGRASHGLPLPINLPRWTGSPYKLYIWSQFLIHTCVELYFKLKKRKWLFYCVSYLI